MADDKRNIARRRKRWLTRKWSRSRQGNVYLIVDGIHVVVWQQADGTWAYRIADLESGKSILSDARFGTEREAKLASFDNMTFLRTERGWGSA